jgi:hypothetical protein
VRTTPVKFPVGTNIEINFGPAIPADERALYWAHVAIMMARTGQIYAGKPSPWWYDAPQFHERLSASGDSLVRELDSLLDGCTGGRAGEIVAEAGLVRMACKDISQHQAARLLEAARENARPVQPRGLGFVGPEVLDKLAYANSNGTVSFDAAEPPAKSPSSSRRGPDQVKIT